VGCYHVGGPNIYSLLPEHRRAIDSSHIPDIRKWRGECFYAGFRWSDTDLFQTREDVGRPRQPSSLNLYADVTHSYQSFVFMFSV
jgi:hypothetical protein